jgi:hypothetical protein
VPTLRDLVVGKSPFGVDVTHRRRDSVHHEVERADRRAEALCTAPCHAAINISLISDSSPDSEDALLNHRPRPIRKEDKVRHTMHDDHTLRTALDRAGECIERARLACVHVWAREDLARARTLLPCDVERGVDRPLDVLTIEVDRGLGLREGARLAEDIPEDRILCI